MNQEVMGRVKRIAVNSLLPKKKAECMTLHLLFLSIFNTSELYVFFAPFTQNNANLFSINAMKKTGATMEMTKKMQEKKRATFLTEELLFLSWIFITEKKVKSKQISMKNLIQTLNLNYERRELMKVPNLVFPLQHRDSNRTVILMSTTSTSSINKFMSDQMSLPMGRSQYKQLVLKNSLLRSLQKMESLKRIKWETRKGLNVSYRQGINLKL